MAKTPTTLEKTRSNAQDLHKKISANIAGAENATWKDVKALEADMKALGSDMKTLADGQSDGIKTAIAAALAGLEAAGKLIDGKTVDASGDIQRANTAMLASAHHAARSLSAGLAEMRAKTARAIEPKEVVA